MVRGVVALLALVASAEAALELGTSYVPGTVNGGYSFGTATADGDLLVATSQVGEHQAVFMKAPFGTNGEPTGPTSGMAAVPTTKGAVVDGCLLTVAGKEYLYAALTKPGFAAKLDTTFATSLDTGLNATSSAIWGDGPIQSLSSVVCNGNYVYFGTSASSGTVSRTVVRLDVTSSNVQTRFSAMSPAFASGEDLAYGAVMGQKMVFIGIPVNGGSPTLYTFDSGSMDGSLVAAYPTTGLDQFTTLSGFYADSALNTVIFATAMGTGRIAAVDMSTSNVPTTNLTLTDGPISSFVADADAKVLYMTVGDCSGSGAETVFTAVRYAPTLEVMGTTSLSGSGYDCTVRGLPSAATVAVAAADGARTVHVLTEVDSETNSGVVLPFAAYPAGACENGCTDSDHGLCAGQICGCELEWSGTDCSAPAPCGGSTCSSHGTCNTATDTCTCDVGYVGASCNVLDHCPLDCSNRGTCDQTTGVCTCDSGFTGLACQHAAVGCEDLNDCNLHGACEEGYPTGTCICDAGHAGDDCMSADTSCPNNCNGNGVCSGGVCACTSAWQGADCGQFATSCDQNCSGHGTCTGGTCNCYAGYKGTLCSDADPTYCPSGCNGHGSCVDQACVCSPGWTGAECTTQEADLRVAESAIFSAGENKAAASFTLSIAASEVVFAVMSTPGKLISCDADTLTRIRTNSFIDDSAENALQALLEEGEGRLTHPMRNALIPDMAAAATSDVSLLEVGAGLGAPMGDAPISVAVAEDSLNGFAILGTRAAGDGIMNGQLMRVGAANMARTHQLEFDDDTGSGVTAGVNAGDGIFYFASGNSPAMIYRVSSTLEILSRTTVEQAPPSEVTDLLFADGSLLAVTSNTVYFYTIGADGAIATAASKPSLAIPGSLGTLSTAVVYRPTAANPVAVLSTDSSVPYALKIDMVSLNMTGPAVAMTTSTGTSTAVTYGEYAYFGHKSTGTSCYVSKFLISSFVEVDTVEVLDCAGDLISSSISTDGMHAYFGNGASPAHVYKLRLFARDDCPDNCNGRGTCVEGTCSCQVGWMGDACGSAVPECPNNCSNVGVCTNGVCTCETGYFLDDCSLVAKCHEKCDKGACKGPADADGKASWPCQCSSKAWTGDFCDEPAVYCPGDCNGHGSCNGGLCVCESGFKGDGCEVPIFPAEGMRGCTKDSDCGTHGVCDLNPKTGTGSCVCAAGWEGPDCDVDSAFAAKLETNKISPGLIIALVVGASVVGMIAGVSIWKSWAAASGASAGGSALLGASAGGYGSSVPAAAAGGAAASTASGAAAGQYQRLPRRLVK